MAAIEDSLRELAAEAALPSEETTPRDILDVVASLRSSVTDWNERALDAYGRLAQRITHIQEQINIRAVSDTARTSETEEVRKTALQAAESRAEALAQELAQREEELAEATQRIAQLKGEAVTLTSEVLCLQKALDEQTASGRQKAEDLERVRNALSSARDQLTAARSFSERASELQSRLDAEVLRANHIEELLLEKDSVTAEAQRQVRMLKAQIDGLVRDNRTEVEALRAENEVLRRVNASLALPGVPRKNSAAHPEAGGKSTEYRPRMGDMLVDMRLLTEDQLSSALHDQESKPQRRIGAILIEKGYVPEEVVARVLAQQLNLPFVRLAHDAVDDTAPRLINGQLAKRRQCIPITATPDSIVLAMANPQDLIALDDVKLSSGRTVSPVVATGTDIVAAIGRYYGLS